MPLAHVSLEGVPPPIGPRGVRRGRPRGGTAGGRPADRPQHPPRSADRLARVTTPSPSATSARRACVPATPDLSSKACSPAGFSGARLAPSTSTLGSSRSSQAGSHQARSPSRCMMAGVSVIRTSIASTITPTARPSPIGRIIVRCEKTNPPKTENMISAAAVTTLAPWVKPLTHGPAGALAVDVRLPHAGDQEHLVVHRQPEEHADEDDRHERDDRPGLADPEDRRQPTPLVDRDRDPEGRGDGEQEAQGRDDRHQDRAEDQQQDDQRQPDDGDQVGRQRVRQSLGDLDVRHRLTGQPDVRADLLTEEVDGVRCSPCTVWTVSASAGPESVTICRAMTSRSGETPATMAPLTRRLARQSGGQLVGDVVQGRLVGGGRVQVWRRRGRGRSCRGRSSRRSPCRSRMPCCPPARTRRPGGRAAGWWPGRPSRPRGRRRRRW
jgi:hypothetical protein